MELFKLFGTIAIQNSDANEQIDDTTDRAKESESKISTAFKKIGTAVATYFAVDKIKDFGMNCINSASDAEAAASQFSQVFGDMEGQAKKSLKGIADDTGIQVNRMKGSYTQIAAFAKTTGMDTESSLGLANRAMVAVADSAAFYDRSLEETTESLQSFLKGNYENDAALGLSCTETTRNAAANKLYGKSFNDLSESQKQLTLLQMVEDANAASGALGQAARESDTWTNQIGNLKQVWGDFQAVLGRNVLPVAVGFVKGLASKVAELSDKTQGAITWAKEHQTVIELVAVGVGTLTGAITAYNIAQGLKNIAVKAGVAAEGSATVAMGLHTVATNIATTATSAFGAVMAFVTSPITLVVVAIGALIAAGVLLYKNWDTVKEKCLELKDKLSEVWNHITTVVSEKVEEIRSVISEKFESAKQKITDIFNSIKDTLSGILENIKNVVTVAVMFIGEILSAAFQIITIPWRFVWENCKEYVFEAWEWIKEKITAALNVINTTISNIWNAIVGVLSPILNIIKNMVSVVWNAICSKISVVLNTIKNIIDSVWNTIKTTVTNVINTILSVITSVFSAIHNTVSNIMNRILSVIVNVWNSVKNTVSNVINSVKSTISSGLNSAKSTVSSVLESIKSKFSSIFESAKTIVKNAIDKIKGFFNFSWSLPKIKLPHFSISGKFALDPPSIPHFSVSWYKKAMGEPYMFTKPTIFDINPATGQARGAGEAGDELMIGKETLLNMIQTAVATQNEAIIYYLQKIIEILCDYFHQLLEALTGMGIVLDDGTLVGRLAPAMNTELGRIKMEEERGR